MYILLKNVVILFALIFLGYFLGKKEIVHNHCASDLSNFLVKVTCDFTGYGILFHDCGRIVSIEIKG
jgi:hypothetical protein